MTAVFGLLLPWLSVKRMAHVLTSTLVMTIVSLCLNFPLHRAFPLTTCRRWRLVRISSWFPCSFETRAVVKHCRMYLGVENEQHQFM